MRIAVGEAHDPHRLMFNHSRIKQDEWNQGKAMDVYGWTHKMEFWGFSAKQPGTIRIAVGEAGEEHGPHRIMVNHSNSTQDEWDEGKSMNTAGWTHKMEFWAYPTKQPGTIRIAVGEAGEEHGPHRIMVNHSNSTQDEWDEGKSMNTAGWTHKMEFWAYPTKTEPDFVRVEGRSEINASQKDISPLLFDLIRIQDYHPLMGTAKIIGDQTEGVGAKRELTYKSGTTFFETVTKTNGVDAISLELTEHPYPCEKLFAHISTKIIDNDNTIFVVALEYKVAAGLPAEAAATFEIQIQGLAQGMALKAKAQFAKP